MRFITRLSVPTIAPRSCHQQVLTPAPLRWPDNADTTPCPNVGNTAMVVKSGNNALITWTAVVCADLAFYRVYGSTSYSAPFPSGWSLPGSPTSTNFSDLLNSTNIAYKIISIDSYGNPPLPLFTFGYLTLK